MEFNLNDMKTAEEIKNEPLIYVGFSKDVVNKLENLGLCQFKPDEIDRVYTRIGVNPDRSNYVLYTEWEWYATIHQCELCEFYDANKFIEIIENELNEK